MSSRSMHISKVNMPPARRTARRPKEGRGCARTAQPLTSCQHKGARLQGVQQPLIAPKGWDHEGGGHDRATTRIAAPGAGGRRARTRAPKPNANLPSLIPAALQPATSGQANTYPCCRRGRAPPTHTPHHRHVMPALTVPSPPNTPTHTNTPTKAARCQPAAITVVGEAMHPGVVGQPASAAWRGLAGGKVAPQLCSPCEGVLWGARLPATQQGPRAALTHSPRWKQHKEGREAGGAAGPPLPRAACHCGQCGSHAGSMNALPTGPGSGGEARPGRGGRGRPRGPARLAPARTMTMHGGGG
jgi:hypothetical protein